MNITFIGAGYVGLVSATMCAELGHRVTCIDSDIQKIEQLSKGQPTLYEAELESYLKKNLLYRRLSFSASYESIPNADIVFIAVGTPSDSKGLADLSQVFGVIEILKPIMKKGSLAVIKSTVPPGTCISIFNQKLFEDSFNLASNPEFLQEGTAVRDFLKPDRVVVGTFNSCSADILSALYEPIFKSGAKAVFTDPTTAELIKYVSNAYLATRVAFINEMSDICEETGGNIEALRLGVGSDRRIGDRFLLPGPGFGGSCFPKDISALSSLVREKGLNCLLPDAVIKSNHNRHFRMAEKIQKIIGGLERKKITILGLTFKAGTDDIRYSPAIKIAEILSAAGAQIAAYDPIYSTNKRNQKKIKDINILSDIKQIDLDSDATVILTEWAEFKTEEFYKIYSSIKSKVIIDLRNLLDKQKMDQAGLKYYRIGDGRAVL
jgi:UDPglucose 6-dehydrogenase